MQAQAEVHKTLTEVVRKAIDNAYTFEGDLDPEVDIAVVEAVLSDPRFAGMHAAKWEYRATACDRDTGDVYDSTGVFDTRGEAEWAVQNYGLLERNPDLPGLVIRIEKRTKASTWVDGRVA